MYFALIARIKIDIVIVINDHCFACKIREDAKIQSCLYVTNLLPRIICYYKPNKRHVYNYLRHFRSILTNWLAENNKYFVETRTRRCVSLCAAYCFQSDTG